MSIHNLEEAINNLEELINVSNQCRGKPNFEVLRYRSFMLISACCTNIGEYNKVINNNYQGVEKFKSMWKRDSWLLLRAGIEHKIKFSLSESSQKLKIKLGNRIYLPH